MGNVSVMCRIDGPGSVVSDARLHPATDIHRAAVFFDLGNLTLWAYDAAAFRRVAEACLAAADQLDHATEAAVVEPVTRVDPRD